MNHTRGKEQSEGKAVFFPQCRDSTPKCVGHPDRSHRLGAMENCMQLHINLRSVRLGILDMLFQFLCVLQNHAQCAALTCSDEAHMRAELGLAWNLTANDSECFSCVISQCSQSVTMICPYMPQIPTYIVFIFTLSSYF